MHRSAEGRSLEIATDSGQDRHVDQRDTIAAISTPVGEGAIAVVRVSGENAIAVADRIFRGHGATSFLASNAQHFGEIVDESGRRVDEVVMSIRRAPHSYTGEDLIEISCHGGVLVTARVLETCLRAGARAARAGEFTERAFLNGKMDLTQAEAVIDLIRAKTDLALRSATEQLDGRLGREINAMRDELIAIAANAEAAIDFPHEQLATDDDAALQARIQAARDKMSILHATADEGRVLREGVRVVVYGATNAGKSSLLNCLLGYERVIVSDTHGTTRDTVEELLNLRGVPVRLIDTAGLRESTNTVEQQGIARTAQSLQTADLSLHIVDGSAPRPNDFELHSRRGVDLIVINKTDLPEHADWKNLDALRISCVTGTGIDQLRDKILAEIGKQNLHAENPIAINARHRDCLRRAIDACDRAIETLKNELSSEYALVDLRAALDALGEIVGKIDNEQILDSVFSQFCIGK